MSNGERWRAPVIPDKFLFLSLILYKENQIFGRGSRGFGSGVNRIPGNECLSGPGSLAEGKVNVIHCSALIEPRHLATESNHIFQALTP